MILSDKKNAALPEKRGDKKLAEYFLADALRGGKHNKNGRVDFLLESGGETHRLPVYEYNYFWSIYERVNDETVAFSLRRKIDRLGDDGNRRLQGEFYTPPRFAKKAYEYLEKTVGKKKLASGEANGTITPEEFEEITLGSLRKAVQDGNLEEGSFLCGAIAGMVKKVEPAKDMIEEMFTEAEKLLGK